MELQRSPMLTQEPAANRPPGADRAASLPAAPSGSAGRAEPRALSTALTALLDCSPRHATSPLTRRAFKCRCGRPVFFGNSLCLVCDTPLGFDPGSGMLLSLTEGPALWRNAAAPHRAPRFLRCANLSTAAACNWLLREDDPTARTSGLCRCCRLTRTVPDLTGTDNALWWMRIEQAKRRLVSSLIALQLPVRSRLQEDPARGLAFDLLRALPDGPPVITGHVDGVITLDVAEADDAWREQRRTALAEPYRTLLGHLRHESGHYYWQRLVQDGPWHEPWRAVFGDEREDYVAALNRHYSSGAPPDWGNRFVSAYASSHPWEDWAETWAHYLHLVDTLDTARAFGLDGERVELHYERFGVDAVVGAGRSGGAPAAGDVEQFLQLLNSWMELIGVLNELSRSMGVADYYPFVLSTPAVHKLYMVHRIISAAREQEAGAGAQESLGRGE